jgi:dTDP-4-dehydrorhamnose 3,5-epimerase
VARSGRTGGEPGRCAREVTYLLGLGILPPGIGVHMPVEPTSIDGLLLVRWPVHDDDRGFLRQVEQTGELAAALGREVHFRQLNHARSRPRVLRGFHAEPCDKLVTVVRGRVFAAIADLRPDSVTFGRVATFELGDPPASWGALFLSAGLGNAYAVLGDDPADYVYQLSEEWTPGLDKRAVAWDDPDLAVPWPVEDPIVSGADRANPTLRQRFGRAP